MLKVQVHGQVMDPKVKICGKGAHERTPLSTHAQVVDPKATIEFRDNTSDDPNKRRWGGSRWFVGNRGCEWAARGGA